MPVADEVWRRIVEEAGEDAVSSAASVSVSHAERDLTAAGFDVKAERAKAEAALVALTHAGALAKEPPRDASEATVDAREATRDASEATGVAREATAWVTAPIPAAKRARSSSKVVWLVAAIAAAATAGGILYAIGHRSNPPEAPPQPPRPTPTTSTAPTLGPEPIAPSPSAPVDTPYDDPRERRPRRPAKP
jgi:hypothetical protein